MANVGDGEAIVGFVVLVEEVSRIEGRVKDIRDKGCRGVEIAAREGELASGDIFARDIGGREDEKHVFGRIGVGEDAGDVDFDSLLFAGQLDANLFGVKLLGFEFEDGGDPGGAGDFEDGALEARVAELMRIVAFHQSGDVAIGVGLLAAPGELEGAI